MGFYLSSVNKYKNKLEHFAEQLSSYADSDKVQYQKFREKDPEFYEYYKTLPLYSVCHSSIKRNKGEAFQAYGSSLRRRTRITRGYTPLANVYWNVAYSGQAVSTGGIARAITQIRETKRKNNSVLERWSAIISAPVAIERHQSAAVNRVVDSSFKSLKGYARGFNSAGVAFGTSLFRILN